MFCKIFQEEIKLSALLMVLEFKKCFGDQKGKPELAELRLEVSCVVLVPPSSKLHIICYANHALPAESPYLFAFSHSLEK